ncbi:MAG TPA: endonuclease/exonuclease/phosphatase family protein, partial [Terrimicrobiaceae bacterium]|nr:endonuclease/exonuclease/phosphatase family protein [Terrimicrobiaceae bacterium]
VASFFTKGRVAAAVLIIVLAVLGFFGGVFWAFDLCAHFRLQYIGGLIVLAVLFTYLHKTIRAAICLTAALLLSAPLLRYFVPAESAPPGRSLKVLSFNVNTANPAVDAVRNFLQGQAADVLLLLEVDDRWMRELAGLADAYPYQLTETREDNFGIALLSKRPFVASEIRHFTADNLPVAACTIEKQGVVYAIVGLHTLPPLNASYSASRDEHLREAIPSAALPHLLVIGDFNLTPFSPRFSAILRHSGLRDSAEGFGLRPTWMSHHPVFAIPIDHALVSKDLRVVSRELGGSLGSDHRPLMIEIAPAGG